MYYQWVSEINIIESTISDAFEVHTRIPEFQGNPPSTIEELLNEIEGSKKLTILAKVENKPVGYLIGLDKFEDGSFYSLLGAVIPEFRGMGVYTKLRNFQEHWAKENGFKSIKVKTWNRRIGMRIALAKLGYNIVEIEKKPDVLDNRLMHEKKL